MKLPFFTIGHSNRSLEEFVELLTGVEIGLVADIRKIPMSRAHPDQAIAEFEASKTLARARQAVELAMAKHNVELPEARDATLKAMKETEQGWRKAIDKIAERASLAKDPSTRR